MRVHIVDAGRKAVLATLFVVSMGLCPVAMAQGSSQDAELAKELQNPVADLITLPLESRFDVSASNKLRYTLNIQPVLPFELGPNLVLVSRTILPVIYDEAAGNDQRSRTGLGDINQSFFLAPKQPVNGWILGAGPVLKLPTATERELGDGVWGAGPTAVALRQDDAWTYGLLASHVWSFAGRSGSTVNVTSLQPFLAYTNSSLTTFGLGSESAYDWDARQWLVPLDVTVSQLVRIGETPVDFAIGGRSYLDRPAEGPNWGIKFTVTFMLPK